jgi:PAS domain S-box-containing protein
MASMHSFSNYFAWGDHAERALQGSYNGFLVFASILIAIFAGYTFMGFMERVRLFDQKATTRLYWIAGGGLVMGLGVWAMHFVAMLAYRLPIDVTYDPLITAGSAVPAMAGSTIAFTCIARPVIGVKQILIGALVMGAGIGVMHYSGMAGMRADAMMMYDPVLWTLSIGVAVLLAFIALSTTVWSVREGSTNTSQLIRVSGAVLMGFAVSGMHYTAMSSMLVIPAAESGLTVMSSLSNETLAAVVVVTSLLIMVTTILSLIFERRLRQEIAHSSHADQQLKYQERRMALIMNNVADALITISKDGIVESFNAAAERIFGYAAAGVVGQRLEMLMFEQDRDKHSGAIEHYLASGESKIIGKSPREVVGRHRNGSRIELELMISEVQEENSSVFIGALRDITQRKSTEAQLQQAQKMEAVGQLSGGIAHDFNNMLGVIVGSLDVARSEVEDRPATIKKIDMATIKKIDMALKAALKGAELNRRLLIFSRRQSLQAEKVDIKHLLADIAPLIKSTVGESITLDLDLTGQVWPVTTDVVQLESSVINLVINARDAMPQGGKLTIAVDNQHIDETYSSLQSGLRPGPYVCLSITDTGTGMSKETLEHVFEPFFTTKEFGKGSGLGLAMVFGFIKQTGGHVSIYSELGQGTTVRLYIPSAVSASTQAGAKNRAERAEEHRGAQEAILVVEDNVDMRAVVVNQLTGLNYQVLEAASAADALRIIESGVHLDLVFSDVVMPGSVSGFGLRDTIRKIRPEVAVLLTSGFVRADDSAGALGSSPGILVKPYRKQDLALAVRRALGK